MYITSISVSTEILKDSLSSAGTFNGITSYYSYKDKLKTTFNFSTYMTQAEIDDNIQKISFFGYNVQTFNGISGNIINVSPSSIVYINSELHYNTSITLVKFPDYKQPVFANTTIYENQIKVAGFYVDGKAYLDKVGSYGKLTKKTFTILESQLSTYNASLKKNLSASTPPTSTILSIDASNYKYIIDNNKSGNLYVDVNITEIS